MTTFWISFELLHLHEDIIAHGVSVDKWTHSAPGQHELVPRIFRKQFLIIAPDRPQDAFVDTMRERLRKFLHLMLSLLFLLSFVLLEHLFGRAFDLHDTDVLLSDDRFFDLLQNEIGILSLADGHKLREAYLPAHPP